MTAVSRRFDDWEKFTIYLRNCNFRMGKKYSNSGEYWRAYNYAKNGPLCEGAYLFITGDGKQEDGVHNNKIWTPKAIGLAWSEHNGKVLKIHRKKYKLFHGGFTARALYAKYLYKEKFVGGLKDLTGAQKRYDRKVDKLVAKEKAEFLNSKQTHEMADDIL